jgi:hypothetical protein
MRCAPTTVRGSTNLKSGSPSSRQIAHNCQLDPLVSMSTSVYDFCTARSLCPQATSASGSYNSGEEIIG